MFFYFNSFYLYRVQKGPDPGAFSFGAAALATFPVKLSAGINNFLFFA
jgi:hypothetical protein